MIYKATLKKPWRSPKGKLYPIGTTFKFVRRCEKIDSTIYDFNSLGYGYGWVVLPNEIFKKPTGEESRIKDLRRKMVEEHIRKTSDPFIKRKI